MTHTTECPALLDRPHPAPARPPHRWWATAVVCLGLFLLGMDLTILNVAVPDLQHELSPSMAAVQWTVDGYALLLGGTVLSSGALTDRVGRRRAFVAGLLLCALASSFGALAHNVWQVIAARCAMGVGAAVLMPATLSVISNLFPEPAARRRAIALWAAVGGAGGMTGPVIGGWLVEHCSWRAAFWINVPLALATVTLALLVVPESRAARAAAVDLTGATLSAGGLLALVWAVIEAPAKGWTSAPVVAALCVAGTLLAVFVLQQRHHASPMLPAAVLRQREVTVAASALALMSFALFGALFVITLYLQGVLRYTPWQAGLRTLPLPAGLAAGAGMALPLMARHGKRIPVVAGLATVAAAFAVLAGTGAGSGYGRLAVFQVIAGIGAGLTAAAATETVMAAVPRHQAGLGSAVNDAARQVGSALGVAVQGSVLAGVYTGRMRDAAAGADSAGPLVHAATDSVPATRTAAGHLTWSERVRLLSAAREAFITGMTHTALIAGGAALAGAALAWWRLSGRWVGGAGSSPDRRSRGGPRRRLLLAGVRAYLVLLMTRPTDARALRVPNPDGRYGPAEGAAIGLALLGDSLAAGVGVRHREQTVGARLARGLTEATGWPVRLRSLARAGATTRTVRRQARRVMAMRPGVAVIVVGGNDALLPVRLTKAAARLRRTAGDLRAAGWQVVVVPCPDYRAATGLRRWVRATASRRSRRLARLQGEAARKAGARVVVLPVDEFLARPAELLSEDGCHPSAEGYAVQVARSLTTVVSVSGLVVRATPPVDAPG